MNSPVRKVVIMGGGTVALPPSSFADLRPSSPADLIGGSMYPEEAAALWMRRSGRRMTNGKGG